jgi:hypothetical protein
MTEFPYRLNMVIQALISKNLSQILDAIVPAKKYLAKKHMRVIPVSRSGNTLVVAFSDPSGCFMRDDLMVILRM